MSCIRLAVTCIRQGQVMVCWDMRALKSNRSTVQSESARRQTGLVLQPVQASSAPKICPLASRQMLT